MIPPIVKDEAGKSWFEVEVNGKKIRIAVEEPEESCDGPYSDKAIRDYVDREVSAMKPKCEKCSGNGKICRETDGVIDYFNCDLCGDGEKLPFPGNEPKCEKCNGAGWLVVEGTVHSCPECDLGLQLEQVKTLGGRMALQNGVSGTDKEVAEEIRSKLVVERFGTKSDAILKKMRQMEQETESKEKVEGALSAAIATLDSEVKPDNNPFFMMEIPLLPPEVDHQLIVMHALDCLCEKLNVYKMTDTEKNSIIERLTSNIAENFG